MNFLGDGKIIHRAEVSVHAGHKQKSDLVSNEGVRALTYSCKLNTASLCFPALAIAEETTFEWVACVHIYLPTPSLVLPGRTKGRRRFRSQKPPVRM